MQDLLADLRKFFKKLHLTNYEINSYIALLSTTDMSAKEISSKSRVPTGRVYDVLEHLIKLGLIEMQGTRPKKYKALLPSSALRNLIAHHEEENKQEIQTMYSQARELEQAIQNSNLMSNMQAPSLFWSAAYGIHHIITLYRDKIRELEKECIFTGFVNEKTLRVLPKARFLYGGLTNLLEREGVVRFLWSFDLDERNPTQEQLHDHDAVFRRLGEILESDLHLSRLAGNFEMKYVNQRILTYFDIFDGTRVILKLRNPVRPSQIFACISVLDPNLAYELTKYFTEIWNTNAIS
jgi:sugar-specific transcriptional regulator TrmB